MQTPQGLGGHVVTNLIHSLEVKNYFVFMGNFFTGIEIKYIVVGLVHENHEGFPPPLN